jgi:hypothetical protein
VRFGVVLLDLQASRQQIRSSAQQIRIMRLCLRDIMKGNELGIGRTPFMLTHLMVFGLCTLSFVLCMSVSTWILKFKAEVACKVQRAKYKDQRHISLG